MLNSFVHEPTWHNIICIVYFSNKLMSGMCDDLIGLKEVERKEKIMKRRGKKRREKK